MCHFGWSLHFQKVVFCSKNMKISCFLDILESPGTPKSWFLTPFLTPFWTIYRNMPTFPVQRIPVLFRVCQKGVKKWLKTMNFGPRGPKMWQPIKMDFLRGVQKWGHFWRPFLNTTFRNHQWFSEKRSQFWSRGCQKVTHFLTLFWTPWFCNKQR